MSDYSAVAPPPQQKFNQSTAFAAALQRAKQIAAKINPAGTNPGDTRQKRPLEDSTVDDFWGDLEPDAKKGPGAVVPPPQGPPPVGRPPQNPGGMGGPVMGGGPQLNEDIKVPDKMVGLRMNNMNQGMGGGGGGGGGGRNFVEIMIPGPKVGLIIGKGGETIKQLQEKSGAKMVVIQDGPNQEQEKPLRISGDPSKVEYAKQLVYDLIAEKEMQNFNRRGGGGGGGGLGRNDNRQQDQYNEYSGGGGGGGGGPNDAEVLVPRQAVGVVIGKGGDMIKKIQAETGARVQFQQAREEGPGERRCYLSGNPKQVEQARQRIEELIDSVHQRDGSESGGGGGGMGPGGGRNQGGGRGGGRGGMRGGGGDRFDRGNNRNGGQDFGGGNGWGDDRRQQSAPQEVTFTVPSSKCGVIIGRGGETIKQINQQSGAYCELDRRSQNSANSNEKTFTIKGEPDQIEAAKRIISDKVQMALNFVSSNGPQMSNNIPTAYPGMAPQGYNPQNWGVPAYQQQWGAPAQGAEAAAAPAGQVQVNPSTGQPDYSLQWAEYYRSLGMHREAEMIEQQAKSKGVAPTGPGVPQSAPQPGAPVPTAAQAPTAGAANGAQPDYSAQWAEYYRSIGKHKEAEAIEAQMKNKGAGQPVASGAPVTGTPTQAPAGGYPQQAYGAYQPPAGYYGAQPQSGVPGAVPQAGYSFPGYGYGAPAAGGPPNSQEN